MLETLLINPKEQNLTKRKKRMAKRKREVPPAVIKPARRPSRKIPTLEFWQALGVGVAGALGASMIAKVAKMPDKAFLPASVIAALAYFLRKNIGVYAIPLATGSGIFAALNFAQKQEAMKGLLSDSCPSCAGMEDYLVGTQNYYPYLEKNIQVME